MITVKSLSWLMYGFVFRAMMALSQINTTHYVLYKIREGGGDVDLA